MILEQSTVSPISHRSSRTNFYWHHGTIRRCHGCQTAKWSFLTGRWARFSTCESACLVTIGVAVGKYASRVRLTWQHAGFRLPVALY
jgi:hypothetical protein